MSLDVPGGLSSPAAIATAARLSAFESICSSEVSDLVLTQSLAASVPSPDAFEVLRRRVCHQMALSCFLTHMLNIGDRSLHKVSCQWLRL